MSKEKLMLASERKAMMAEELPKLKLRARSTLAQAEDVVSAVMDDWNAWRVGEGVATGRWFASVFRIDVPALVRNRRLIEERMRRLDDFAALPVEVYSGPVFDLIWRGNVQRIEELLDECYRVALEAKCILLTSPFFRYADKTRKEEA